MSNPRTSKVVDLARVLNPGEFVQIIVRNLAVVTTTGAITVVASLDHYYE